MGGASLVAKSGRTLVEARFVLGDDRVMFVVEPHHGDTLGPQILAYVLHWQDIPLARDMDTVALDYATEAGGVRIERPGAVSMGNPHAVFFVHDVEHLPIARLGPEVELDPLFPERVNAGFAQIYDATHIRLRVWERGAGITAACGTGAWFTMPAMSADSWSYV